MDANIPYAIKNQRGASKELVLYGIRWLAQAGLATPGTARWRTLAPGDGQTVGPGLQLPLPAHHQHHHAAGQLHGPPALAGQQVQRQLLRDLQDLLVDQRDQLCVPERERGPGRQREDHWRLETSHRLFLSGKYSPGILTKYYCMFDTRST